MGVNTLKKISSEPGSLLENKKMEMMKRPAKPGAIAKFIAILFVVLEIAWLSITLPNPYVGPGSVFGFLYFYFFIVYVVGPFFIIDMIRYLRSLYQLLFIDKVFLLLDIAAVLAILYAFLFVASYIHY